MLNKHQLQNIAWTLTPKSWPNLFSKFAQNFSFMIKPQLPNPKQTVANTIHIINISNSDNLNKFWVGNLASSLARVTSINITEWVSESVSQLLTSIANDRKVKVLFTTSFGVFIVILSSWQRPKSTWKICLRIKLKNKGWKRWNW